MSSWDHPFYNLTLKHLSIKSFHAYFILKKLDKCTETDQLGWNLTSNQRMNGIHL